MKTNPPKTHMMMITSQNESCDDVHKIGLYSLHELNLR